MNYLRKTYFRTLRNKLLREANKEESPPPTERLPKTQGVINPFSDDDMAFVFDIMGSYGEGVTYSNKTLIDELIIQSGEERYIDPSMLKDSIKSSILAYMQIKKSPSGCNGAWEVKKSAGKNKGLGKLVYGMGYHISTKAGSGSLIPDRSELSPAARDAWRKVRAKSAGKTLDNMNHPEKSPADSEFNPDPFHDKYHTEDTSDDCITWPIAKKIPGKDAFVTSKSGVEDAETQDAVNRSYTLGDMGYDFDEMSKAHDETVKFILDNFVQVEINMEKADIEMLITNAGTDFFYEKV